MIAYLSTQNYYQRCSEHYTFQRQTAVNQNLEMLTSRYHLKKRPKASETSMQVKVDWSVEYFHKCIYVELNVVC